MQSYLEDREGGLAGGGGVGNRLPVESYSIDFSIFTITFKALCIKTKQKQNCNMQSIKPLASLLPKQAYFSIKWNGKV